MIREVGPGVICCDLGFVNAYLVGQADRPWAMIDTGVGFHFEAMREAAASCFGKDSRPEAIYLTHGHRDHAGAALALAAYYDVPIYAHRMELPYLTGKADYPPYDPTVGGTFGAFVRFVSNKGRDLGEWVKPLPDGPLPGLPGWRVVETPGHTPGHLSFFRESDRVLLAGDACATVDMDKGWELLTGKQRISRPASPVTPDWLSARKSMRRMASLKPRVLACGHGKPIAGDTVAAGLYVFSEHFMIPLAGRYVSDPARFDENGVTYLPPKPCESNVKKVATVGVAVAVAWTIYQAVKRGKGRA